MPSIIERSGVSLSQFTKRQFYGGGYCNPRYQNCNGYSTGARVGTGIGVAVAVILIIVLLAGCGRRRRRLAAQNTTPAFTTNTPSGYYTGQQGQNQNLPQQSYEQGNNFQTGYYPQSGNQQGGYQYPPNNYGAQPNYAPPEGPPPAADSPYQPPSVPPPVYRESEKKERGVVDN